MAVNDVLEARKNRALQESDFHAFQRNQTRQQFNDQAYFILCWGQIEKQIDEVCLKKVPAAQLHRLRLKSRAQLALGIQNSPTLQFILDCYRLRNSIAHGDLQTERFPVVKAVVTLRAIIERLPL